MSDSAGCRVISLKVAAEGYGEAVGTEWHERMRKKTSRFLNPYVNLDLLPGRGIRF